MASFTRFIRDVQDHREPVHIVYKSHDRWPLPPNLTGHEKKDAQEESNLKQDLGISVLDSSFNPPTLAHLSLARSKPPEITAETDYDARLLLLSVRNADKGPPKSGEPTYEQRLEMMTLLARELEEVPIESSSSQTTQNVAVAIIDEPTFVRKSAVLRQYLRSLVARLEAPHDSETNDEQLPTRGEIKLSFIMGLDTLERFLAPRYYNNSLTDMHDALRNFFASPPAGDGSKAVCAWRGRPPIKRTHPSPEVGDHVTKQEEELRETLFVAQPFVSGGSVSFISLNEHEMALSSTDVREKRAEGIQEWRTMTPSAVGEYIESSGLYVRV